MDIEPGELTVGQLSERSGVAISALHFYERQNLIVSRRTSGNQRRYKRDTLRRVALIRIAQRVGIPLADVAGILALLPDNRTPTRQDWERISQCWQAELDRRIVQLEQLRDDFKDCVGCGCLSLDRCALANPYDALAARGPGPRRLVDTAGTPCRPNACADTTCEVSA
ncbi:redox-sensitive transcriptional activator SoxR [Kribbella sp. ALI-6-A]|uniref:redox-sensitive transcriptional activator SoxR n=1 Tax=Kribbella sp. ALI-6-A TaxID=1933817 RepID=UPI00097C9EEA|nr:redox-sensitive transcriptional activator SoxR [Kribbella sp. ALI-6-A]ONI69283.1 redox-sensitive transcriptional activator SoxR [Kribbella sp. ALI-6-A]